MFRLPITVWLPALAAIVVATVGGGLGVIFMVLRGTIGDAMADEWGSRWHNTPIIVLGLAIVVLAPLIAAAIHLGGRRDTGN